MDIQPLVVFAKDGEKSKAGLNPLAGFPKSNKPARQWFNSLFNDLTLKANEIITAVNTLVNKPVVQNYAIGDLYITTKNHNNGASVASQHGYGTWSRYGGGRALVGLSTNTGQPSWTQAIGGTGGSYTHTLSTEELPSDAFKLKTSSHHEVREHGGGGDSYAGGDQVNTFQNVSGVISGWQDIPHNNTQPSITVGVWLRTA